MKRMKTGGWMIGKDLHLVLSLLLFLLARRSLCFCHGAGSLGPQSKSIVILKNLYWHFVITHDVGIVAKGLEGPHAGGLIVGTIRIIDLEIQRIVIDQRKEQTVQVDSYAAEHSLRGNGASTGELFQHIIEIVGADGHVSNSELFPNSRTRLRPAS